MWVQTSARVDRRLVAPLFLAAGKSPDKGTPVPVWSTGTAIFRQGGKRLQALTTQLGPGQGLSLERVSKQDPPPSGER